MQVSIQGVHIRLLPHTIIAMTYSPDHVVAAASVTRSNSTAPSFTSLTLPGGPGITAVATCCSQNYNNGVPNDVYATSVLVVASNLQAVFVSANDQSATAWVTTTQGSSKGVASAVVQLYVTSYSYSSGQVSGPV